MFYCDVRGFFFIKNIYLESTVKHVLLLYANQLNIMQYDLVYLPPFVFNMGFIQINRI